MHNVLVSISNKGKCSNVTNKHKYLDLIRVGHQSEAPSIILSRYEWLCVYQLPPMKLYCEIRNSVCWRIEKGAVVMVSEYLNKQYPVTQDFSPRNFRSIKLLDK